MKDSSFFSRFNTSRHNHPRCLFVCLYLYAFLYESRYSPSPAFCSLLVVIAVVDLVGSCGRPCRRSMQVGPEVRIY